EKPVSAPVVPRRPATAGRTGRDRISPMPLIFGIVVLVIGFSVMKLLLNVQRRAPGSTAQASPSASPVTGSNPLPPGPAASAPSNVASAPSVAPTVSSAPTLAPA